MIEKSYTIVPNEEAFYNLENEKLENNFSFFYSIFFKSKKVGILNLLKSKNLVLFTFKNEDRIIISVGNKVNCEYQKYNFIEFEDFLNIIKNKNR